MNWLSTIWRAVKDFLAPIVAYFMGKHHERLQANAHYAKMESELAKKRAERDRKIYEKYSRIRRDIDRCIDQSRVLAEEGRLEPIEDDKGGVSSQRDGDNDSL